MVAKPPVSTDASQYAVGRHSVTCNIARVKSPTVDHHFKQLQTYSMRYHALVA